MPTPCDQWNVTQVLQHAAGDQRAYGAYAAALEPQSGDDDTARLLRYLGRRPDWTPA